MAADGRDLSEAFWERAERLTTLRRDEQRRCRSTWRSPFGGHMGFLIEALDGDPEAVAAGAASAPTDVDAALVREAIAFLRRTSLPIEPRAVAARAECRSTMSKGRYRSSIEPNRAKRCASGAMRDGAVWSGEGKYRDGRFSDDLVALASSMVRDWNPQPAPTGSPAFRRCGIRSGAGLRAAPRRRTSGCHSNWFSQDGRTARTEDDGEQHPAGAQHRWLAGDDGGRYDGPVLLVDDMVDSRWTLTVAAWLLRRRKRAVWPMALCSGGARRMTHAIANTQAILL